MFELPNNTTPQVRPEVVNRIMEAMFNKGSLSYCDDYVSMDGEASFSGRYSAPRGEGDKRTFKSFTNDERKAAFEEFRKKGWHIAKETWYSSVNYHSLWCYIVSETRDTEEDRDFKWLF